MSFSLGNNTYGDWVTTACQLLNETRDTVTCQCNHLTNFAILLDVYQKGKNIADLTEVTWIGCIVSIISLVLTILTYILSK